MFDKPSDYAVMAQPDIRFAPSFPEYIAFIDDIKGEVGRLEWKGGLMTFTGNADASAKLFFDAVCANFNMEKSKETP